jgi:hypothetical protein
LQPARNFAGTVASVERKPVQLDKNKDFKKFDSLLSTSYNSGGMCLGCDRYTVSATLVGRLDGVAAGLQRDSSGKIVGISGFGNLNAYSTRLVLQSVSEVTSQEIDYSKTAVSSGEGQIAQEFGSGIPLQDQPKRAAEAFGKEGEDNGVNVGFGVANEATPKDDAKSQHDSPDGVLFNCTFDMDRLKGDSMGRALSHLGEHIADLRNPEQGIETTGMYQLEFRAWVTTELSAIGARQKTLMLPGGYLIWSSAWPTASLNKNTKDALTSFLSNEELLAK